MARARKKASRSRSKSTSARSKRKSTGRSSRKSRSDDNTLQFKEEVEALLDKLTRSRRTTSLRDARRRFERSYVEYVIRKYDGDRQRAADRLDIGFSTLKEKIRKTKKR